MSKPNYRVHLSFDPDRSVYQARVPELEHCAAEGSTRAEAIQNVEDEIDAQLANMLSHGATPPRSVDEETFSGEIVAKVSRTLHRDLVFQSRQDGVDLEHFVGEILSAGLEARRQTRGGRSAQGGAGRTEGRHHDNDSIGNRSEGRRGGFGRGGYNPNMEDRANFIEYVRNLDAGGNRGGGHGPGRGGEGRGGDGRRRRRGRGGGGGGGGGGGFQQRRDGFGPNHGPSHQGERTAAPADARTDAPGTPPGGGEPEPGNR